MRQKNFIILLLFWMGMGLVSYSRYAVVNLKLLYFLHPKMKQFNFSSRLFPWVEDQLNKEKEELKRLESLYQALMEKESILKQKLKREELSLKKGKLSKKKWKKISAKIERTILWSQKKRKAISRKMDSYSDNSSNNIIEKLNKENLLELKKIYREVRDISVKYALSKGYEGVFDISIWLDEVFALRKSLKKKIFSKVENVFVNNYRDFIFKKRNDLTLLEKWQDKGFYYSLCHLFYQDSFLLYGGDDISWRILKIIYKKYQKGNK